MGFSGVKCNAETSLRFLAEGVPLRVLDAERAGIRMSIHDLMTTIDRLEAEAAAANVDGWWRRLDRSDLPFLSAVVLGPLLLCAVWGGC